MLMYYDIEKLANQICVNSLNAGNCNLAAFDAVKLALQDVGVSKHEAEHHARLALVEAKYHFVGTK